MDRARSNWFLCLALILATASIAMAQPKLIITTIGSDLSNDGNTVIGTILDPNVYSRLTTFTRGTGFLLRGPVLRSADGGIQMSDITAGNFFAETGLYNGFNGSTYWPQSSPGLFGNYTPARPCCNGTTCVIMEPSQCFNPGYTVLNISSCSPNPCAAVAPVTGGCCNATTGVCTYTTQAACGSPNYWIGGDLACGNYPCSHGHTLPFRFSSATDSWTNAGSIPNNTGGAGQGAAHCDAGIATPYSISSNGRYIVGGSWYGAFGSVACGTRGFIYDSNDTSVQMLPLIATNAGCQNFNQAWAVSADGLVVLGRDTHASTAPGGAILSCNATCLAVWDRDLATGQFLLPRTPRACCNGSSCTVVDPSLCPITSTALSSTSCTPNPCPSSPATGACCNANSLNCSATTKAACGSTNFWIGSASCSPRNPCLLSTETVLDEYGAGGLKEAVMTRNGAVIASTVSSGKADYVFLDSSKFGDLIKYVKNAGTGGWDMVQIGKVPGSFAGGQGTRNMIPSAISDDGNTIVGAYNGGSGSFIWSTSINLGVPMDLASYIQTLNGGQPYPPTGTIGLQQSMSASGNALLVAWNPPVGSCGPNAGLSDLGRGGVLYLNGASIGCEPPAIAGGPYDVIQREYTRFGMVGNVFVSGSYPMTMQWQRETTPNSNTWVDLQDSCGQFTFDDTWTYEGTHGFQLRVNMLAAPAVRDGRYRVIATNECGSATSAIANFSAVSGACCYYDSNSDSTACFVTLPTRCTQALPPFGLTGVYLGDGIACTPSTCNAAIGACCYYSGGTVCVLDVSSHCTATAANSGRAGSFAGVGTTCTPTICDTVSGACCYSPDGISSVTCTFELSSRCTRTVALGGVAGVYSGNGIACSAGPSCPAGTVGIGACCFNATLTSDIVCSIQASTHCTGTYSTGGLQGKYQGDSVTCGASTCKPSTFGVGSSLGACCCTDPANPASGTLCVITFLPNCQNYPNGSNDANTAPFSPGLGGNFYTNTCCMPSNTPPISGCTTTANCAATAGACINTPFDNSTSAVCTLQVRASRCTRRYNAGGLFGTWVPNTACSPAVLAANTGACCYQPTDGSGSPLGCVVCTIQPQDRCITVNNGGLSGVYGGNGTSCTPVAQCPTMFGACCNGNTCTVVGRNVCVGTFYGLNSTTCSNVGCSTISVQPPPTAACCNTTTGACIMSTQAACASPSSWIYTGSCTPTNACLQPGSGACCLIGNACLLTCPGDCGLNGGIYRGDATTCNPDPCAPTGICCRGSTCATIASTACTVASGTAGAFFASSGTCGTSATSPCCYANYNKLNGISVQDIFDFLSDWFAGSTYANVGGNGTPGPLSVQNIFDFLGAWFAGGC